MSKKTLIVMFAIGCATSDGDAVDGIDDTFVSDGKADGGIDEGSREALAVLKLANEAELVTLDDPVSAGGVGLDRRAAEGIVARRPLQSLAELDAVPYVGPIAFAKLRDYVALHGYGTDPACLAGEAQPPLIIATWSTQPATTTVAPTSMAGAMVYDVARTRGVFYDGANTWVWDDSAWTQIADDAAGPTALRGFAMAYDDTRDRVLLFGGETNTYRLDETWELDGNTWRKLTVAGPSPRTGAAMAYDRTRERIVLFGGRDGTTTYHDLWEWDGSTWTAIDVTGDKPNWTYNTRLVSAPSLGGVALVPDYDGFAGVWAWTGTSWAVAGPTLIRFGALVVYDEELQTLVAYGGSRPSGGGAVNEVSRFDGWAWTRMPVNVDGHERSRTLGYYDRARSRMVTYGGSPLTTRHVIELAMVAQDNRAPSIEVQRGGQRWFDGTVVFALDELALSVLGDDPDGHRITFGASDLPAGATIDAATGQFRWTPGPAQAGTHAITFGSSDGDQCTTRTVQVTVRYDEHPLLPTGAIDFATDYSGISTQMRYGENSFYGTQYTDQTGRVELTITGTNPGKVTVRADVRVYTPYGGLPWQSDGSAVVSPDGRFYIRLRADDSAVAGRIEKDAIGDLRVVITRIDGDKIFGDDEFFLSAHASEYLLQQ